LHHSAVALAPHPIGVDMHDTPSDVPPPDEAASLAQAFFPLFLRQSCLQGQAAQADWLAFWGELEARLKREGLPLQECGLLPDSIRDQALRQGWSLHGRHGSGWPRLTLSGRPPAAVG
jgi:hypothetical protein